MDEPGLELRFLVVGYLNFAKAIPGDRISSYILLNIYRIRVIPECDQLFKNNTGENKPHKGDKAAAIHPLALRSC